MTNDAELKRALELARAGDWDAAHEIVQNISGAEACRIHAYLHRVEGDEGNAGYWYRRAGTEFPDNTIDEEWEKLAREFGVDA